MRAEQVNLITDNFKALVQSCDLEKLIDKLVEKGVPREKLENNKNFNSYDKLHNKRCFFFALKHLDDGVYLKLVASLRELGLDELGNKLDLSHQRHCIAFQCPDDYVPNRDVIPRIASEGPLEIKLNAATEFRDSVIYNKTGFYKTRSKNRGVVLVINNYIFNGNVNPRRRGAEIDTKNIIELFPQMGLKVISYENLTAEQMMNIIRNFARFDKEKIADILFVIIMSHGGQIDNQTVINGSDNAKIETSWIIKQFNNETCDLFLHKPKIFLFQTCRGLLLDNLHSRTQRDSANVYRDPRTYSDILVAYPTVKGYKAHRDTERGSWFIDVLCEIFMNEANQLDVESMLKKVDERFRFRMSEEQTMQTLNYENIGFKNCYLNPGIYENEEGRIATINY